MARTAAMIGAEGARRYARMVASPRMPPPEWQAPCTHTECTLHQLSPYIGKLKSVIARDLILEFSKPGDLVLDPFAGSGTVALEAILLGRRAAASDMSPYARVLCMGKLLAPSSVQAALSLGERALAEANDGPDVDLRRIPAWVRAFFHRDTLRQAIQFASLCMRRDYMFLMGCLLGILHHQRPGFLSYPSSHLVPYLRDKKFPRRRFPEMYDYRDLRPRLLAKIRRAYKRIPTAGARAGAVVRQCDVRRMDIHEAIDCVVTSPPYMNALDYNRDNRLRLWFIDPEDGAMPGDTAMNSREAFEEAIRCLAQGVQAHLRQGGHCVVIVGEGVTRSYAAHPSQLVHTIFTEWAPGLRLTGVVWDRIPDVRRSRRRCSATKVEHVLVYRRDCSA
jgi:hypothetical protein